MATYQNLIDDARVFLKDADKVRYPDAQLLSYANEVTAECKRVRPDFFLGTYTTALATFALTDTCPIPIEYQHHLKDYIVGRAELVDDEYASESRGAALIIKFKNGITGL